MATDEVGMYNLALSVVGSESSVASPTEDSREAEVCRLWYLPVVESVLRAARWPSARAVKRIALLQERDFDEDWVVGDPEPPWIFAYAYPSDMLRPRYLTSYGRFMTGLTDGVQSVLTNEEDAILVYTTRQLLVTAWDAQLQLAIAYTLGGYIAQPLSGKRAKAIDAIETANRLISQAQVSAANQDMEQFESVPAWILERGVGTGFSEKFMFPDGPIISLSQGASPIAYS